MHAAGFGLSFYHPIFTQKARKDGFRKRGEGCRFLSCLHDDRGEEARREVNRLGPNWKFSAALGAEWEDHLVIFLLKSRIGSHYSP